MRVWRHGRARFPKKSYILFFRAEFFVIPKKYIELGFGLKQSQRILFMFYILLVLYTFSVVFSRRQGQVSACAAGLTGTLPGRRGSGSAQ